tara:strand:- start:83 stop:493 length:411 start_codon:yes stop_codon:yes gene_type:complete
MANSNVKDFLGVKKISKPKTKTNNTNKSLKALISDRVNQVIHETLLNEFSDYYKCIEATSFAKTKNDDEREIVNHNGWKLMIPTTYTNDKGETFEGDVWSVGEPTLYIKGLKATNESNFIFDYKETQKATITKETK